MAYKYAGNTHDLHEPWPEQEHRRIQRPKPPTRKHKERKPKKPAVFQTDKCGTDQGYERHKYRKIPACEPCKSAHAAHRKAERHAAKATA